MANKELCLVSCSGGLDSTTTLAMLKLAGYENIIACHFDYGCRSGQAEKIAITNICKELDIPLKIFDISTLMKSIDTTSMLMDENAEVTTGTSDDIKTTAAWVHGRNMIFLTIMASFAEAQVMQKGYNKVFILGGMLQLSESGCFIPVKDSTIMTIDNKEVDPLSIKVGDKLLSFNFEKKEFEAAEVKHIYHPEHEVTYKVHLIFNEGTTHSEKTLLLSKEHPLFIKYKGWVEAEKLLVGDICYTYKECDMPKRMSRLEYFDFIMNHDGWIVEKIEEIKGKVEMLNFNVEPNNNFFLNKVLTHNTYPDNSEYFLNSFLELCKYGTLIGDRIEPMYGLSDLMKKEQFALIKEFDLIHAYKHAISCDRAKVIDGVPHNCMKDGIPACGSGLLSYWGSKMIGMDDTKIRKFYEIDDPDFKPLVPEHLSKEPESYNIHKIIDRIHFPKDKLDVLHNLINQRKGASK